ncbi:epoxide hydrolase [Actinomycetospora sp. NBRC 106375]|uniref:alpha/beta fold hydrolase n=1 Tax=Actinomycetospora sp. NBRC 106375 TaxID=3032207 RepID=UPI00249FEAB2|nr:alpha/beta hydrolase [Actinomycetospora sp. NBRC 106375]GLZ46743.1 epoxide hydrolase [Actinomycetospora sp. NBRC 106375]
MTTDLPAGFTVHRVPTHGTNLAVTVGGAGPVLVLLHGWPQTSRAWWRVMPALARRFTVVAPDLRGTGDSDRPEDGYAKVDQAEDVRGVLDALGLDGPVTVVGHDIGAMVAFAWAASRPDDVSALVLLDALLPGFGLEEAMDVARGGMWHFGFFMAPGVPEMLFDGHEREFVTATFTAMSAPGTFDEDDLAAYAASYTGRDRLRGGFAHYRAVLDDGRENRRLLAARPLRMPVLAVGAGAGLPPAEIAEHLTTRTAPTGHFVAEEDPDWLVRAVTEFTS